MLFQKPLNILYIDLCSVLDVLFFNNNNNVQIPISNWANSYFAAIHRL